MPSTSLSLYALTACVGCALTACVIGDPPPLTDTTSSPCDDDTGSAVDDTGAALPVEVEVTWQATYLELAITNGDAAESYSFGLTETDVGDPWTGEDCVYGYTSGGTSFTYCHPASVSGVALAYDASHVDVSDS